MEQEQTQDREREYSKKYNPDVKMVNRIQNDFTYHPPIGDQQQRYVTLREMGKKLAMAIVELTPPSREQSAALTNLEQAIFSANAAIARNE